jgi:hypothetical protein
VKTNDFRNRNFCAFALCSATLRDCWKSRIRVAAVIEIGSLRVRAISWKSGCRANTSFKIYAQGITTLTAKKNEGN